MFSGKNTKHRHCLEKKTVSNGKTPDSGWKNCSRIFSLANSTSKPWTFVKPGCNHSFPDHRRMGSCTAFFFWNATKFCILKHFTTITHPGGKCIPCLSQILHPAAMMEHWSGCRSKNIKKRNSINYALFSCYMSRNICNNKYKVSGFTALSAACNMIGSNLHYIHHCNRKLHFRDSGTKSSCGCIHCERIGSAVLLSSANFLPFFFGSGRKKSLMQWSP